MPVALKPTEPDSRRVSGEPLPLGTGKFFVRDALRRRDYRSQNSHRQPAHLMATFQQGFIADRLDSSQKTRLECDNVPHTKKSKSLGPTTGVLDACRQ